jgi:hypothetical protein
MARSSTDSAAQQPSRGLFGDQPISGSSPGQLDVTFAKFLKQERLGGRSLFEGFECLRAVTYSSSPEISAKRLV